MPDFSQYSDEELFNLAKKQKERTVGGIFGKVPEGKFRQGERNILGNIFERPAAATRAFIQNVPPGGKSPIQAYKEASIDPSKAPRFQDIALNKFYKSFPQPAPSGKQPTPSGIPVLDVFMNKERRNLAGGFGASALGLGADIATDPAALLASLAGKIPGVKSTGQALAKTRPVQAIKKAITSDIRPFKGGEKIGRQWKKFKQHPFSNPERVKRAISGKKGASNKLIQADKEYTSKILAETDDVLKNNIESMKRELQASAEKGSLEFQGKLKTFIRKNSEGYGDKLDSLSEALSAKNEIIDNGEIYNVLSRTVQEAIDAELPSGRAQSVIEKLLVEKYGESGAAETFTLKEILNDVRAIKGSLKSGVQAGAKGFSPDEVIVSIFNKNWGDVVAERIPELAKINKSYAPVIQAMKKSHKIFKPYKGTLETKTGTEFLKRVGTGGAEAGELRFLKQLEKGSEFAKGVGGISAPVKKVGAGIKLTEAQKPILKKSILTEAKGRQSNVEKNLQGWLNKLSGIEREAVLNQWKAKGGLAAGGGLLIYLVKRKLADTVLDALSGQDSSIPTQQGQF